MRSRQNHTLVPSITYAADHHRRCELCLSAPGTGGAQRPDSAGQSASMMAADYATVRNRLDRAAQRHRQAPSSIFGRPPGGHRHVLQNWQAHGHCANNMTRAPTEPVSRRGAGPGECAVRHRVDGADVFRAGLKTREVELLSNGRKLFVELCRAGQAIARAPDFGIVYEFVRRRRRKYFQSKPFQVPDRQKLGRLLGSIQCFSPESGGSHRIAANLFRIGRPVSHRFRAASWRPAGWGGCRSERRASRSDKDEARVIERNVPRTRNGRDTADNFSERFGALSFQRQVDGHRLGQSVHPGASTCPP